jgi:hypothetical protein
MHPPSLGTASKLSVAWRKNATYPQAAGGEDDVGADNNRRQRRAHGHGLFEYDR